MKPSLALLVAVTLPAFAGEPVGRPPVGPVRGTARPADLIVLHPQATPLPFAHFGPFVRLGNGAILGVESDGLRVTRNEGKSWESRIIFDRERFEPRIERALLRTRNGTLVFAFINAKEIVRGWDQAKGGPLEGARTPLYVMRSSDDGQTWSAPQLLQDGWCGAVRNMIELRTGRIVLISQLAVRDPGRHVSLTYTSDDQGMTWRASNRIDLGEYGTYGDHGGGIEGTAIERADGILWMLLRTPQGCFSEVVSPNGGSTWLEARPSQIAASPAPGTLTRLSDGRVVLVWNRWAELGADPATGLGRRNELSMAFSADDGRSWTSPVVVARAPLHETVKVTKARDRTNDISYPYLLEVAPGQLWVTTMRGALRMNIDVGELGR